MSKTVTLEVSDTSSIEIDFFFQMELEVWTCNVSRIRTSEWDQKLPASEIIYSSLSTIGVKRFTFEISVAISQIISILSMSDTDVIRYSQRDLDRLMVACFKFARSQRRIEQNYLKRFESMRVS